MIGALNSLSISDSVAGAEMTVALTPDFISVSVPNGKYTTTSVSSVVTGGTPNYTYEWSTDSELLTINTPDQASTTFTLSGINRLRAETAVLKVTDSSNPAKIATRSVTIDVQFGDRL